MKKNLLVFIAVLFVSTLLTGCGGPLKQLPKATGENIYISSTEGTGNEACDTILRMLVKNGAVKGRVSALAVYNREDNKDKDKSKVYLKIDSENADTVYQYYVVADCRYTKDDGWRLKDFEYDSSGATSVTPRDEITLQQLMEDMSASIPEIKVLDGEAKLDFKESLAEVEIESEEVNVKTEDLVPTSAMSVKYNIDGGYCNYIGTMHIGYIYNDEEGNAGWVLDTYELDGEPEKVLNNESLITFADKKMIANFCGRTYNICNKDVDLTEDMIDTVDFEDLVFDGYTCTRKGKVKLKTCPQISISFDLAYKYTFNGGKWKMDEMTTDMSISDFDVLGTYSGYIYTSKKSMEDGEDSLGKVYYSILKQEDDNSISGGIRYVNEGQDAQDVEPVMFSANYYENMMAWKLQFDSEVDDRNYGFDKQYLYFDPFTGELSLESWIRYFCVTKIQ